MGPSGGGMQLLVVAGPSGVGKGTLLSRLRGRFPGVFEYSVSCTSRAPRDGEVDGKQYHFVTREAFLEKMDDGEFLEHAVIYGDYYGTLVSEVHRSCGGDKICLLEVDVQGVEQIMRNDSIRDGSCVYLFISPPSLQHLRARLENRATETREKIAKRVAAASRELEAAQKLAFTRVIVNDDLDEAYSQLEETVIQFFPFVQQRKKR